MKLWKKIVLVLILLVTVSQIPFCFRRYQIGLLDAKINEINANRTEINNNFYQTFKGVIHVHTRLGGHSAGDFGELIKAANDNNLDFVVMTEHPEELFDTARLTLGGKYGKTLFIAGNEVSTAIDGDRFLLIPGSEKAIGAGKQPTNEFLTSEKTNGRIALVTYPENFKSWDANFEGIEVYSLHTNAKKMSPVLTFFDLFWSWQYSPELTFARNFERPNENLARFDELAQKRKVMLFAATDAHSNIGLALSDRAGHEFLKIHLDPYQRVFKLLRNYVVLEKSKELNQDNLQTAISKGHCFYAFDILGDANVFMFQAENGRETRIMGDEIQFNDALKLTAKTPLKSRLVLFKNGEKVHETTETNELTFQPKEKGAYRIETYLDALGSPFDKTPWIVSNPIFVK
jgi:hypothetical protein